MNDIKSYFPDTQKLADDINRLKKPNPNNWPIVDKWNQRYVVRPATPLLFNIFDQELHGGGFTKYVKERYGQAIDGFADINEISIGEKK